MNKIIICFSVTFLFFLFENKSVAQLINKNEYINLNNELFTQYSPIEEGWVIYKFNKDRKQYLKQEYTESTSSEKISLFKDIYVVDDANIFMHDGTFFKRLSGQKICNSYKDILIYSFPHSNVILPHAVGKDKENKFVSLSEKPMICDTFVMQNSTFIPIFTIDKPNFNNTIYTSNGLIIPPLYYVASYNYSIRKNAVGYVLSNNTMNAEQIGSLIHSYPYMNDANLINNSNGLNKQFDDDIFLSYYNANTFLILKKGKWYICKVSEDKQTFDAYLNDLKRVLPKDDLMYSYFGDLEANSIRILSWESDQPAYFVANIQGVDYLYDYRKANIEIKGKRQVITFPQNSGISGDLIKPYYAPTYSIDGKAIKPLYIEVKQANTEVYFKYQDDKFAKTESNPFKGNYRLVFSGSNYKRFGNEYFGQILSEITFPPELLPFEVDFLDFMKEKSIAKARDYKQKYPSSFYLPTVDSLLHEMEYTNAIGKNTIDDIKGFLNKYPSSKYNGQIVDKLNFLEGVKIKVDAKEDLQKALNEFNKKYPNCNIGNPTDIPLIDPDYSILIDAEFIPEAPILLSNGDVPFYQIDESFKLNSFTGKEFNKQKVKVLTEGDPSQFFNMIVKGNTFNIFNNEYSTLSMLKMTIRHTQTISGIDFYDRYNFKFDMYGNINRVEAFNGKGFDRIADINYSYDSRGNMLKALIETTVDYKDNAPLHKTKSYHIFNYSNNLLKYWLTVSVSDLNTLLTYEYSLEGTLMKVTKNLWSRSDLYDFLKTQSFELEFNNVEIKYSEVEDINIVEHVNFEEFSNFLSQRKRFTDDILFYSNANGFISTIKAEGFYPINTNFHYFENAIVISKLDISDTTRYTNYCLYLFSKCDDNKRRLSAEYRLDINSIWRIYKQLTYKSVRPSSELEITEKVNVGTPSEAVRTYYKNRNYLTKGYGKTIYYNANNDISEEIKIEGSGYDQYKLKKINFYNEFGLSKYLYYNSFRSDYKLFMEKNVEYYFR